MSATVATYLSLIIVGLRWETLPSDVAFVQDVLRLGGTFVSSLLSSWCKSRSTHSAQYPRPPRTPTLDVVREVPEASNDVSDASESDNDMDMDEDEDEDDSESEESSKKDTEEQDVDTHMDTSDHESHESHKNDKNDEEDNESDNDIAHTR
jgi:hypothetical protein